ncbi:acid phosphatase [Moniliophthora roreri MCA 2997]|uniref:Acid phosphatase n=2 Tax=Moniliophthora roreri TaxID=221103 RepID=V2XW67_MONRO|nr:acid phosphatase [Moniliophthora roreri MCA 2997]KAI3612744.1 acid phosphatase [Moniliophthora roreri]
MKVNIQNLVLVLAASPVVFVSGQKRLILTNDDGWAVAMIRAQNDALKAAGYDVVLSCPAVNKSGTGSNSSEPTILQTPCEFDTCPIGSPAVGFNETDPRLNYVNSFPADAARFGIQTLAPKFFDGSPPDFVVSGPNVGSNLGPTVLISGTVGAASGSALDGIPSVAFSAPTPPTAQVSYTTLESDPNSSDTLAALTYATLTTTFVNTLLGAGCDPILPSGISINVNYPNTTDCLFPEDFKFVLSRINADSSATDVETCGTTHLPQESMVVAHAGCFTSVSVFNASTKADVDAGTQAFVLKKLAGLLTCLPN